MLSENAEKALALILRECGTKYKVMTDDDFEDVSNVRDVVDELSDSGYISLRYSVRGEYLLAPSYKARKYYDEKEKYYYLRAVLCRRTALFALLGGAVGSLAGVLIALLAGVAHGG